jgi:hypothetical protein
MFVDSGPMAGWPIIRGPVSTHIWDHTGPPPPTRHSRGYHFHSVAAQNMFAAQNSLRHRRCWVLYAANYAPSLAHLIC